jgi:hypothetical protein
MRNQYDSQFEEGFYRQLDVEHAQCAEQEAERGYRVAVQWPRIIADIVREIRA